MLDNDSLPSLGPPKKSYVLPKTIPAIPVISSPEGPTDIGTILQLPEGLQIEVCGEGFNERTVKVRSEGGYFFIFLEDLDPALGRKASAHTAG